MENNMGDDTEKIASDYENLTKEEIAEIWDQGTPVDLDDSVEELFGVGPRGQRKLLISDEPNPLKCPNCDTVGEWVRDSEDPNKILCARDGTHIMTQVSDEEAALAAKLQDMVWKIDNEGLDYFLLNYIDMVPNVDAIDGDGKTLRELAEDAMLAIETFEHSAKAACSANGIEYDQ